MNISEMYAFYRYAVSRVDPSNTNFLLKNKNKKGIIIRGVALTEEKGVYCVDVDKPWLESFRGQGGEESKLAILLNFILFERVRKIHGPGITEEVYEKFFSSEDREKIMKEASKYTKKQDGMIVTTPNLPWKPWGSEFSYPLGSD